jgi:hypothetical protein
MDNILEMLIDYWFITFLPFFFGSLFLTYLAIRRKSWLWMLGAMLFSGLASMVTMLSVGPVNLLFILQGIGLVVLLAYSLWRTLRKQLVRFRSGR